MITTATTEAETVIPRVLTTEALTPEMPAPEAFAPDDLAMESNPITTVESPSVEHNDSNNVPSVAAVAVEASPEYSVPPVTAAGAEPSSENLPPSVAAAGLELLSGHSDAYGNAPPNRPETTATGWLGPPAATPISKITFDGTPLPFASVHLIITQMDSIACEIENFASAQDCISPSDAMGSRLPHALRDNV